SACRRCGRPLSGSDLAPLRHQVAELPLVRPEVVEYQLHRLVCPCCHTSTCGTLPPGVCGPFGPRLEATLALLAGRHRLGLRPLVALAADLWGLDIDETPWREGPRRAYLWGAVTPFAGPAPIHLSQM